MSHYRDVEPREACEVLVDGEWLPGELRAWRRRDEVWEGFVTWTHREDGMPANRVGWFPADRLRAAQDEEKK